MAYTLEALIAGQPVAAALAEELGAVAVPLGQGTALIPLPSGLTPHVESLAARVSERAPIVYAEAEFFGGVGEQHAILWRGGKATALDGGLGTINAALQALGVRRSGDLDEFDSVRLGRHRSTLEWATDR